MANVYVMRSDGQSEMMTPIRCKNEDEELQRILENNHDLLPGDQIDPEDERQWLLIKREMPVPNPCTGRDQWSIDFFFSDQDAVPTLVECKRYDDPRSRREVVGQMLEYAANGHHYWDKEGLRVFSEETAKKLGYNLVEKLKEISPGSGESVEQYFELLEQNLRAGQLRIVFFLEQAPAELKSIVDFLNKQMERTEVLLVEARQYQDAQGVRVIVPTLFGYTEQARQIKRTVTVNAGVGKRRRWNHEDFIADAQAKLGAGNAGILDNFLHAAYGIGCEISWGTGIANGSYNITEPMICRRSLLSVYSNGSLYFNYHWLNGDVRAELGRDMLKSRLSEITILDIQEKITSGVGYCIPFERWAPVADRISNTLKEVSAEFRLATEQSHQQ